MSTPPRQIQKEQSEAEPEDPSPKQVGKEQSEAKSEDVPPDQVASESSEPKEEEEEEEGECGFCLFMKGGGCKEPFIDWENCIQEAEKNNEDIVEKCAQVTAVLKQCMDAHSDYYEPILRAEKMAEQQAVIELEKQKREEGEKEKEKEKEKEEEAEVEVSLNSNQK